MKKIIFFAAILLVLLSSLAYAATTMLDSGITSKAWIIGKNSDGTNTIVWTDPNGALMLSPFPPGNNNIGKVDINSNLVSGTQVCLDDPNIISFAAEAAANTQVVLYFTTPSNPVSEYKVSVYHDSNDSDLTLKTSGVKSFGGGTKYTHEASASILKNQSISGTAISAYSIVLKYPFVGGGLRLVFSNDTALGADDTLTGLVIIEAIK